MSWLYRTGIRPLLFTQDSEEIHNRTVQMLGRVGRQEVLCEMLGSFFAAPRLPVELFGLHFPNPIGLAAGMDKYALALPAWEALGFGFTELGGVTWLPQSGNPAPRMFRAVPDRALINRMGFNNPGAEALAQTLAQWRALGRWPDHPVGINLGKSKITPLDRAAEDYARSFRTLHPYADFFVVNVSSPNTPNLRQLQEKSALDEILAALQEVQDSKSKVQSPALQDVQGPKSEVQRPGTGAHNTSDSSSRPKPILIKVAPDLSFEALDDILELVSQRQLAGIVATNTTLDRPKTSDADLQRIYAEPGGLSGRPLRQRSTEIIRHLRRQTNGAVPIIGVGGVFNADDAWEKIRAGASLVQLYTGLVYEGPGVVKAIVRGLEQRLHRERLNDLRQAIGVAGP